MSTDTQLDLKAIEERAAKATPGPWAWFPQSGRPYELRMAGAPNSDEPIMWVNTDERLSFIRREDRDLLEHAREDIPALVARVKELEEALRPLVDVNVLGFRRGGTASYQEALAAIERARKLLGMEANDASRL